MTVTKEDLSVKGKDGYEWVGPTSGDPYSIDASATTGLFFRGITEETFDSFKYTQDGKNLVITYSYEYNGTQYNKTVTILNYFTKAGSTETKSRIKTFVYGSSENPVDVATYAAINSIVSVFKPNRSGVVTGTMFSDEIDMTNALTKPLNKKNKGLTIKGGKGKDDITGSKYNDTIIGGEGTNIYNYDFVAKTGIDTIKLTNGETLILNLKNGEETLACKDVNYGNGKMLGFGNDLFIYTDDMSNMVRLSNFLKTANATVKIGDENLSEYLVSADFDGISLSGVGKITGTIYNDNIIGSDRNDTITAKEGNDKIDVGNGKDTVVETGNNYGHDIINSSAQYDNGKKVVDNKVTVKIDAFDSEKLSFDTDGNLIYKTNDNSDFTYNGFKTGEAADLWIADKKKSYHIIDTAKSKDYTNDKTNKVVYMSGNDLSYTSSKKGVNIVYSDGVNTYNYQGGNDIYYDNESTDDNYTATINKSGALLIDDKSGKDSLTLNNKTTDLSLFYNINLSGADAEDLVIYNKNAISYKNLVKAYKNDSYTGAAVIDDYFSNGEIETIKYNYNNNTEEIDISGWRYYIETMVKDYLSDIKKESVEDVLLNGSNSQKSNLASIFKSATYGKYQALIAHSDKYSDIRLEDKLVTVNKKQSHILNIYRKNANGDDRLLYSLKNFLSEDSKESVSLLVVDDNKRLMTMNINAQMQVSYNLGNDNRITINDENEKVIRTADGSNETLLFTDRAYSDFYTKGELSGAYTAGDPLIQKDGNDLVIGNVKVEDIDGKTSEIQIVDKNNETKNIIIGSGTINGTFESEIIIGSNDIDTINSNGNNDLIYMGDGDDTLNVTSEEKGDATGKNTAKMTGIGGTTTIEDDLTCPAISVYDASGDDTYNTSFDYGLYIEDFGGNDTLNIKYNDENIMYFFDVVNPNHESENPTIYTDLMICDKTQFTSAGLGILSNLGDGQGMKSLMEDMQGSFGYAWIDDHFGTNQNIENINIIGAENSVTSLNIDTEIAATKEKIASWLAGEYKGLFNKFEVNGDYATAWDVIESGTTADKTTLAMIYSKMM